MESNLPLAIVGLIYAGILVLMIAAMWGIFAKAGKPGWAAIVPIYNIIVMLDIAKKPRWWIILFFIPVVNLVFAVIMTHGLSVAFGKGAGYTIGMLFLPFLFMPLLAFGDAEYQHGDKHMVAA